MMISIDQINNAMLNAEHARQVLETAASKIGTLAPIGEGTDLKLDSQEFVESALCKLRQAELKLICDFSTLAAEMYACHIREQFQPGDEVRLLDADSEHRTATLVGFRNDGVNVEFSPGREALVHYLQIDLEAGAVEQVPLEDLPLD